MGGPGSGNRWRSSGATCEQYHRIDLRYLKAHNMLMPGFRFALHWTYGGEPSGDIRYIAVQSHLELVFRTREHGETEWRDVKQIVPFEHTSVHFGGNRKWFNCPGCKRRCIVLYGGARFYCRKCYRLQYQSQSKVAR